MCIDIDLRAVPLIFSGLMVEKPFGNSRFGAVGVAACASILLLSLVLNPGFPEAKHWNLNALKGVQLISAAQADTPDFTREYDFGIDYPDIRRYNAPDFYPENLAEPISIEEYLPKSIWEEIRQNFAFPHYHDEYVVHYEQWYVSNPKHLQAVFERAQMYLPYIYDQIRQRGMPSELALLPVIESAFNPHAYSRSHALGIWQFIPSTGRKYGLHRTFYFDGRRDVVESTRAALDYLEYLHELFDGNWIHAVAAYNGGENRIRKELARVGPHFKKFRLKRETRRYVPKLIAVKNLVEHPEKYGITLHPIHNMDYFSVVSYPFPVDLHFLSSKIGISMDEMSALNPGLRVAMTPPEGPHRVAVPSHKYHQAKYVVYAYEPKERLVWVSHLVKKGEILSQIATLYGVPVHVIAKHNNLRSADLIVAGSRLIIPRPARLKYQLATRSPKLKNELLSKFHLVQEGDTLWKIAAQYNVEIPKLRMLNKFGVSDYLILPGQKVQVKQ